MVTPSNTFCIILLSMCCACFVERNPRCCKMFDSIIGFVWMKRGYNTDKHGHTCTQGKLTPYKTRYCYNRKSSQGKQWHQTQTDNYNVSVTWVMYTSEI